MRYTIHAPVEQFGYVEAEGEMTAKEAVALYREVKSEWGKKEVDKIAKVESIMRKKEIADPQNHIDIELPINE